MKYKAILAAVCTLAAILPGGLAGQDRNASSLLAVFGTQGDPGLRGHAIVQLVDVLSQKEAAGQQARLDSIADGLVSFALIQVNSVETRLLSNDAIVVLSLAARRNVRVPYTGAVSRLDRIANEAPDYGSRAAAMFALSAGADAAGAIDALERLAIKNDVMAAQAITALAEAGSRGRAVLMRLDKTGRVKTSDAKRVLKDEVRKSAAKN